MLSQCAEYFSNDRLIAGRQGAEGTVRGDCGADGGRRIGHRPHDVAGLRKKLSESV